MTKIFLLAAVLLLSACGGGSGDAPVTEPPPVTPPPVVVPPPASFAALAGVYRSEGMYASTATTFDVRSGTVHVHADGSIVGTLRWYQSMGNAGTEDLVTFSGSLSSGLITYTYTLRDTAIAAPPRQTTWEGSGSVAASMTPVGGAAGITVQLPPDGPFRVKAYTLPPIPPLPSVYIGLAPEKLGGWLQFSLQGESILQDPLGIYSAVVHHDVATGLITGSLGPQCQIAGKQYAYDPTNGMVRQDWTVSGTGCPTSGTSQMVGRLLPGAVLGTQAGGLINGKWMTATLSAPLPTLPMPYGAIAGTYDPPYEVARGTATVLHPDGTLRITVSRTLPDSYPFKVDTGIFFGRLTGQGATLQATGEFAVVHEEPGDAGPVYSYASGTATVQLTPGANLGRPTVAVRIDSALTPPVADFVATLRSRWSLGQPFARLTGAYTKGLLHAGSSCAWSPCEQGTPTEVQLDADGNLSGTVLPNCQLTGRILEYDQAFGVFRHDATLQGSGCPVTGTAQLSGTVSWVGRGSPNLALHSSGVLAGRPFALTLIHATNKP